MEMHNTQIINLDLVIEKNDRLSHERKKHKTLQVTMHIIKYTCSNTFPNFGYRIKLTLPLGRD